MPARILPLVALSVALGGCSLSAITSVHETFPETTKTVQQCREYAGGDFQKIAEDMAFVAKSGWKVKLTGHEDSFWFGIYETSIWVCYEKSDERVAAEPAETPTKAAAETGSP